MDPRLPGVYLIAENLGGFSIEDIEDRVFLQKAIYLIQLFGVDLRYRFSWYLRGPYSKDLTQTVYQIDDSVKQFAKNHSLKSEITPALEALSGLLMRKPSSIERSEWLELISSIHFLKHFSGVNVSPNNVAEQLERSGKPQFSEEHALRAWEELQTAGLIENKTVNLINQR